MEIIKDLQKNYKILQDELLKNKEEIKKLQNLNYSLALFIKSIDSKSESHVDREIF